MNFFEVCKEQPDKYPTSLFKSLSNSVATDSKATWLSSNEIKPEFKDLVSFFYSQNTEFVTNLVNTAQVFKKFNTDLSYTLKSKVLYHQLSTIATKFSFKNRPHPLSIPIHYLRHKHSVLMSDNTLLFSKHTVVVMKTFYAALFSTTIPSRYRTLNYRTFCCSSSTQYQNRNQAAGNPLKRCRCALWSELIVTIFTLQLQ